MYFEVDGVRWQRRCQAHRSLLELDNSGTVLYFFIGRSPWLAVELNH